ncbi:F-box/LRR-repeat protein [Trifolium pratense]|uniref:F-box/LRR-repeat protein n=1 Tax=Trifolium pratense TaxID=57577 RepID=A0A2K3PL17_TRIPR|nr:F-box/LRR-repeat protein [Trifolium pratense]
MAATQFYLPNDCWESVFKFLSDDDNNSHCYSRSLSLVSKQFFSITNSHQFSLNVYNPTHPFLHYLFKRFTNLTNLNLSCFHGDLDALLSQISCFRLNLTSLNISNQPTFPRYGLRAFSLKIATLTSLTCSKIDSINSSDLFLIVDCFPLLEELNFSNPGEILPRGAETFSLALFKLSKVNLSGHSYINDQLLLHLLKKCKHLKEVIISDCSGLTIAGIASSLRERPTLRSLSLSDTNKQYDEGFTSHFIDSLVSLKGLTCIHCLELKISDELLYSIAREALPLTRLVLKNCTGYSYDGLYSLLSKCQGIQHLDLQMADFLNDQYVAELSLFLGNLVSINLNWCSRLTKSALCAVVRNCPSLDEIKMNFTCIGKKNAENSNSLMDRIENHQLKSLCLTYNPWLRDKDLKMFASIFSNLRLLDLSHCRYISNVSIGQVLSRCYKIRHLNLAKCTRVRPHRLNFESLKLEVLNLSHTHIDDEALCVISRNCCGLLKLFLQNCERITGNGVTHVIKNCKQLKEINLRNCLKVPADVVASMVFLRPSLRKITSPSYSNFSDIEKKHFRDHGCHVFH